MFDSLGDRIKKNYENRSKTYLVRRMPVILRLDGKAFHTFTKHCNKPFDTELKDAMVATATALLKNIQGAKLVYQQSDEISVLITDYDSLSTDAWFDYNIQKMCSIASAIASVKFTLTYAGEETHLCDVDPAYFDCRAFNIPKEEVANYFLWRFNDWVRNSVAMVAQSHYSAKELHGKGNAEQHEMIFAKGQNWNDFESKWKNGTFLYYTDMSARNKEAFGEDVGHRTLTVGSLNIKELDVRNNFIDQFIN